MNLKNRVDKLVIFDIVVLLFVSLAFARLSFQNNNFLILFTYVFNGIIFLVMMNYSIYKYAFSLSFMHWMFLFFFMFFAPFIQYASNNFPWNYTFEESELLRANLIVLIWATCFIIVGFIKKPIKGANEKRFSAKRKELKINRVSIYTFFCISALITLILVLKNGISGLLTNRADGGDIFYSGSNSSVGLILDIVGHAFITFATLYLTLAVKKNKKYLPLTILQYCFLLLCCFPTTMARYKMVCIYLGLFLVIFESMGRGIKFSYLFIFGFIIVFPLLNCFRTTEFSFTAIIRAFKDLSDNFILSYTEGHYDAYTMLAAAIRYVDLYDVTYGMQLIGVALFWVPRTFWGAKPIGSGATIMEAFGSSFTNISCPIMAEGYINFGIIGVIIFAVIFSLIVNKVDRWYWQESCKTEMKPFYLFAISLFFFMCRGDLLSSFAYFTGFLVTYILVFGINRLCEKCVAKPIYENKYY